MTMMLGPSKAILAGTLDESDVAAPGARQPAREGADASAA